jgi:membrane protein YqaA with SNARE-associated domain
VKLLLATFFFSIGSALLPLLNAEAFVAVVSHTYPAVLVSLVAAAGQMVGKTIWYYAGANAEKLPWLHRKLQKPKMAASLEKWRLQTEGRPVMALAVQFASAAFGFPPYAVIAALAGVLRVHYGWFLACGFVGRFLRFWVIAELAGVLIDRL